LGHILLEALIETKPGDKTRRNGSNKWPHFNELLIINVF